MNRRFFARSLLASLSTLAAGSALSAKPHDAVAAAGAPEPKADKKKLIFPPALKPGSTVGIAAPASGASKDEIQSGVRTLESLGLNVVLGKHIYRGNHGFLAAPDEVRAEEFMEFIQRKDIDAIICARGGYGVMRILPMLDYDIIRVNPKIIMGFSDITALLNTISARCHLVTFHGPVASGDMDEFTRASLLSSLFALPQHSPQTQPTNGNLPTQHLTASRAVPTTSSSATTTYTRHSTTATSLSASPLSASSSATALALNKPAPRPDSTAQKLLRSSTNATVSVLSSGAVNPSAKKTSSTTKTKAASKTTLKLTKPSPATARRKRLPVSAKLHAQLSKRRTRSSQRPLTPIATQRAREPMAYFGEASIGEGTTTGRLVGGNLTILCALLGTPFEVATADKILFLEDVNEEPYRIDRMLTQLWLASKLQQCAGIVLGRFARSEASTEFVPSYSLEEVLRSRLEPLGIPVVSGFQFGHVRSKFTLPIGVLAELNADTKKLTILEQPVAADNL